jgi:integrase
MASLKQITVIRYVDTTGRQVPKATPGAGKKREKSATWYGVWNEPVVAPDGELQRDGSGSVVTRRVCRPLSTDKTAAQVMLGNELQRVEQIKAGVLKPKDIERLDRMRSPVADLVNDYLTDLKAAVCPRHYEQRSRIVRAVVAGVKAKTLAELTPAAVKGFIDGLKMKPTANRPDPGPVSARTRDTYRIGAACFGTWLVEQDILKANPLAGLKGYSGKRAAKVRRRRALKADELRRLIDAAARRPLAMKRVRRQGPRKGESSVNLRETTVKRLEDAGRQRALLYKVAVFTGLRRQELAALKVGDLDLDAKPFPTLALPGQFTKNGEDALLCLVPSLAEELRAFTSGRPASDPLFRVAQRVIRAFRKDLAHAGIPYADVRGRFADFHSLRKTGNVILGTAGVDAKVRQLFLRHGNIGLTTKEYDDDAMYDLGEAVQVFEGLKL